MTSHNAHLDTLQSVFIAKAGPDFKWNASGISSKRTDEIRGLTAILVNDIQGGICAACGDAFMVGEAIQLCHLVASRKTGFGIAGGNVYAGHQTCNDDDYKVYGDIVPVSSLVRSDLVATDLPSRQACLTRDQSTRGTREARLARRQA